LGFNKFNGSFPASLFYLSHLKFLDLSRNSYQGHIPASSSLEQVPLQVLDPHNNLTSILPTKQGTREQALLAYIFHDKKRM
jgi:hypothetical protein